MFQQTKIEFWSRDVKTLHFTILCCSLTLHNGNVWHTHTETNTNNRVIRSQMHRFVLLINMLMDSFMRTFYNSTVTIFVVSASVDDDDAYSYSHSTFKLVGKCVCLWTQPVARSQANCPTCVSNSQLVSMRFLLVVVVVVLFFSPVLLWNSCQFVFPHAYLSW